MQSSRPTPLENDALVEAESVFGGLRTPTPKEMKDALTQFSVTTDDLERVAGPPGIFPYGRSPLFQSNDVEVLVMNWAPMRECAPHDHGGSFGWIKLMAGTAQHILYTLNQDDVPVPYLERVECAGSMYFAPRGQVHAMANHTHHRMLTVHVYSPPIANMMVYDLAKCAACVVSDDCGAWWPTAQRQILREIRLLGPPQRVDDVRQPGT